VLKSYQFEGHIQFVGHVHLGKLPVFQITFFAGAATLASCVEESCHFLSIFFENCLILVQKWLRQ
jgi:hypothetical protein